ncbi:hypothetical protein [Sorangium sp. So ce1389]|uniref:hypothetical protein n=1 Tax=Sorangium sp. So ce1389 TaxID=3133336 RepID=UPI003F6246BE
MRTRQQGTILVAAVAVLGLGAGPSGCLWERSDDSLGSFCARPAGGDGEEYCVGANRSPGDAWSQAEAHGDPPIEMWAELPRGVSMRDLAASKDTLDLWLGNVDRVVSYVRDEERNAESYGATLFGELRFLLEYAAGEQRLLLQEEPVRAPARFKEAMIEKVDAERDPLLAALAADSQSMAAAQAVFERARDEAAPLQAEYARVVARFRDYRATEAVETAAYAALAGEASRSTGDDLDGVERAVLAAAREASRAPSELAVDMMALSAQIQASAASFEEAIAPHGDFLATHGAALPDMSSGALRSLNAMLGYVQQRVARSDRTATALLGGVGLRRQALLVLQGGQEAREAIVRSRTRKASEVFREAARARASAVSAAPPVSERLGLPLLAERCGALLALVQVRPLCEAAGSSWREAGCAELRGQFDVAEAELRTGLPRKIAAGLAVLREKGMAAAPLDAAQTRLDAGDVKGAAMAYDAAVRGAEGT